ncbi:MAG: mRNA surveillance protein pelota [Promethearchaeota archaeon]
MKVLENNQKQGEITVKVESLNDLWTIYNVVTKNDIVSARTHRRVIIKEGTKGTRKSMFLTLKVETISFHEFSNRLRIKGTILEGPEEYVSYGAYHTLNIESGQTITIKKEMWFKNELKRLKETSKFESNFVMLIIAMESGLATIAQITNFSHNRIATIKKNIPGKRYEQSHRNKAYQEFFIDVKKVIDENISNVAIDLVIVCGPGNVRDQFIRFLKENGASPYVSKIKNIHASSGTESAILETLKSKKLANYREKVKIIEETKKIEEIFDLLGTQDYLISIGFDEIAIAANKGAVKELFIVDVLIRGASKEKKLEIEELIRNVEYAGGSIHIFNSTQSTGQQLVDLGSLLAILRYRI